MGTKKFSFWKKYKFRELNYINVSNEKNIKLNNEINNIFVYYHFTENIFFSFLKLKY